MHYAYLMQCADGSFYGGYTTDPYRREKEHNSPKAAKYTRARQPVQLAYYEEFSTRSEAMQREAALKKLSHEEKKALAESFVREEK